MRTLRRGAGLVAMMVTALLLALLPATAAQAAGTGEQNWCGVQGIASPEANRAVDAACAEWRARITGRRFRTSPAVPRRGRNTVLDGGELRR